MSDKELYAKVKDLGSDDLKRLYYELGISPRDVKNAEEKEKTEDIDLKAKAVLRLWRKRNGKEATPTALEKAVRTCKEKHKKGKLVPTGFAQWQCHRETWGYSPPNISAIKLANFCMLCTHFFHSFSKKNTSLGLPLLLKMFMLVPLLVCPPPSPT